MDIILIHIMQGRQSVGGRNPLDFENFLLIDYIICYYVQVISIGWVDSPQIDQAI